MVAARILAGAGLAECLFQAGPSLAEDREGYQKVSFYFAAHEDDWQLFMNPTAFTDVTGNLTKAVFVYTTAGDAGLGRGAGGRKHPYYVARENGAEAAVRFMSDTDFPTERSASIAVLNGHPIHRVAYRNTVSYFLRGADGNLEGTGYPATGYQSLKRLAAGQIGAYATIDGLTIYHGWSDIIATLRSIINHERGSAPSVRINVAETDTLVNSGDHADHLATAKAALAAASPLACVTRAYYINYASAKLPENLGAKQRDLESSVFAVTAATIRAFDHFNIWRHYDDDYIGRNYFRIEKGAGPCAAAPAMAGVERPASAVPASATDGIDRPDR
jgi:hypothetical protein